MAELADAADSKSADGDIVRGRPPLRVRLKLWRVRAAIVRNASLAVFLRCKIAFAEFSIFSARLRGSFFLFFMHRLRACRAARKKNCAARFARQASSAHFAAPPRNWLLPAALIRDI